MENKTVVFDFDGVIHKYSKGWQDGSIYDEPVEGIKDIIDKLRKSGYQVVVVSTRTAKREGLKEVISWLNKYHSAVDDIQDTKPPAICYIDDRAITFNGNINGLYQKIVSFENWITKKNKYDNMSEVELIGTFILKQKELQHIVEKTSGLDPRKGIEIFDKWLQIAKEYMEEE